MRESKVKYCVCWQINAEKMVDDRGPFVTVEEAVAFADSENARWLKPAPLRHWVEPVKPRRRK